MIPTASSKLQEALSNLNQSLPRGFCSETKILLFWLVFVMPGLYLFELI